MRRKPSLQLSEDLERAILCAILSGKAEVGVVQPTELSPTGRAVLKAATTLGTPTFQGALLHLTEIQGLDKQRSADYLSLVQRLGGEENAAEILQAVRDKQTLIGIINSAHELLSSAKGPIDLGIFNEYLGTNSVSSSSRLNSVAERLKDGFLDPPVGLSFRSFPKLYEYTGGIYGSWVIGGEPKLGKTGVAWQITLDTSATNGIPAIYYDLENSFLVLMDHTRRIFRDDLERVRRATQRVFYRDSIKSLEDDLRAVPAPALVVVDHIQRLPSSVEFRKAGFDKWIHRLDGLKKRGYTVLMVSEIGRASYNSDAHIGAFKESGEIEYAAETGIQLLRGAGDCIEVHVVANRHRPHRGLACMLSRYNDWAFRELGEGPGGTID